MEDAMELLSLLQLASPTLPIGAYSYSEGLETLCHNGVIASAATLQHWLGQELQYGAVRLEAAVMLRVYRAVQAGEAGQAIAWNDWLSAIRETEEMRRSSWQMGQSLLKLAGDLEPLPRLPLLEDLLTQLPSVSENDSGRGCNFATAYALVSVGWNLTAEVALLGYLHAWASNLTSAGVKLIPLGQTAGQQLLLNLRSLLLAQAQAIAALEDHELESGSWGSAIASMQHETQYSRLFRS